LKVVIVVHGGAWDIPRELEKPCAKGVTEAAKVGMECLLKGGSALDAVEVAVKCMEDNPVFDAGIGSVLNASGEVELDAAIMDGRDLQAGAVAAVKHVRNPVSLARKVMEETSHVLLVGEGATKFAEAQGFERFEGLVVERELEKWRRLREKYEETMRFSAGNGTVGAVAMDVEGNVAAATSTGGTSFKLPGRVGDSCLIGCGLYADNEAGGVSATGHGESIMRVVLSKVVCELLRKGSNAQKAAEDAIKILERKVNGRGGVIVLDRNGNVGFFYNTPKMARAYMKEEMNSPISSV